MSIFKLKSSGNLPGPASHEGTQHCPQPGYVQHGCLMTVKRHHQQPADCPAATQRPPTSDSLSHRLRFAATELAATQPSTLGSQSQPCGTYSSSTMWLPMTFRSFSASLMLTFATSLHDQVLVMEPRCGAESSIPDPRERPSGTDLWGINHPLRP